MEGFQVHAPSSSPVRASGSGKRPPVRDDRAAKRPGSSSIRSAEDTVRLSQGARAGAAGMTGLHAGSKTAHHAASKTGHHAASKAPAARLRHHTPEMHDDDSFDRSISYDVRDVEPVTPTKPKARAPVSYYAPRLGMMGAARGVADNRSGKTTSNGLGKTIPAAAPARGPSPSPDAHANDDTPRARLPLAGTKTISTTAVLDREKTKSAERRTETLTRMRFKKKGEAVSYDQDSPTKDSEAMAFFKEEHGLKPEDQEHLDEKKRALVEEDRARQREDDQRMQGRKAMDTRSGNEFFDSLAVVTSPGAQRRLEKVTAALERADYEAASVVPAATRLQPPPAASLTDEEEQICRPFRHKTNTCPYCEEPMPAQPTPHLKEMGAALREAEKKAGKPPNWRQTRSYCSQHRAETRIVPLGRQAGFLSTIDFIDLDRRLQEGFVRARLHRIARRPTSSKFFLHAELTISEHGLAKWMDPAHQTKLAEQVTAGYYGDLGRAVIVQHFQQLVSWGHLSLTPTHVAPITVPDFILSVLVPEAAILLIMQDQGWSSEECRGGEWKAARKAANAIRKASREFGQAKFSAALGAGPGTLLKLEQAAEDKRARLEDERSAYEAEIRDRIGREKDGLAPIYVSSSAGSTSDFSVSGDEEREPTAERTPMPSKRGTKRTKRDKPSSPLSKSASQASRPSSQARPSASQRKCSGKASSPIPVSPDVKKSHHRRRPSSTPTPQSSQDYDELSWDEVDFDALDGPAASTPKPKPRR